jgi:hypothetical protein
MVKVELERVKGDFRVRGKGFQWALPLKLIPVRKQERENFGNSPNAAFA